MTDTAIPDQPDGIDEQGRELPCPHRAAERVKAYICATGDGLYDVTDGAPLYGRDLEALCRAVQQHDRYTAILAAIGDALSPTGERPPEALGTLAADVEAVVADAERLRDELDAARADLADYRARLGATSTAANHHANRAYNLTVERDWLLAEADDNTRERFARIRAANPNPRPAYLTSEEG